MVDLRSNNQDNNMRMANTIFSLDKALEFVGDNSRYQKRVINLLSATWMLFSFMSMGLPFLFQEPIFKCRFSETDVELQECSFQQACKAYYKEIDEELSSDSVTKDFGLYCDRQYLIGLSGSIFFVGNAFSGLVFPQLSNKKGRKYALCLSVLISGISIIVCGLSQNITQFMIMLFFCGLGLNGFETISLVYVSEISAEKFRNYSTIFLGIAWSVAQIFYGVITYYVTSWRYQCIILMGGTFLVLFVIMRAYFLETPRYLASRNRFKEARQVLDSICVRNRRPRFEYKLEGELDEGDNLLNSQNSGNAGNLFSSQVSNNNNNNNSAIKQSEFLYQPSSSKNYGYFDLFRYGSLRNITLTLIVFWSFRYMIYFGQSFSLSSLGAEMHSNLTLTALSETVAILMSAPIKIKMKRIPSLFWFSIITTLSCISLIFLNIPEECYLDQMTCLQKGLIVFSAMGIRFGVAVFGGVLMTYTSERYPTVVRSLGYGICIASGKIITIFVPMIVVFVQGYNLNPLAFFGFLGVGAAIMCRFIKETHGQEMQDQIEETLITETPLIELGNIPTGSASNQPLLR